MSIKQEHRNSVRLAREAKAHNDCIGQREAMRLVRPPRPALAPVANDVATRHQVAAWMQRNAGHANATELAEGANCALKLPPGCMDDETQWVWDVAYKIAKQAATEI